VRVAPQEELFATPCDLLIPAAVENSITGQVAAGLRAKAVVPGANLAVTAEAESRLSQRGILVLPDFVAGCGSSLAMEGLFGPKEHPAPVQVLAHLEQRMAELVRRVLARSEAEGISPTAAALRICAETVPQAGRPYGDPTA
jgi:glutamate dehydrogenase (NAD(P)+)